MKKHTLFAAFALSAVFSFNCYCQEEPSFEPETTVNQNIEYTYEYSKEKKFTNPARLLKNPGQWKIQYPAGFNGMESKNCNSYSSKFYSLYTDKSGTEWIHFAVLGKEEGTSKNSTHPRSELRHKAPQGDWEFKGLHSLSYTMNASCSEQYPHFWVGQIHGEALKPPVMIRVTSTALFLELKDPESGYDITKKFLCPYEYGTDINIKILVEDKTITVFTDGIMRTQQPLANSIGNYWKLGLYASSTKNRDPDAFYEVFIKDIEVE